MSQSNLPPIPRALLSHLLVTLNSHESRHCERYGALLDTHADNLEEVLYSYMRKEIIRLFDTRNVSARSLQAQQPPMQYTGTGIYIHIIHGRDKHYRYYTGQSNYLATRIKKQHLNFRYRYQNPSLHYHAMHESDFDTFVIVARIPDAEIARWKKEELALVLNILEMWCALCFGTLPRSVAMEYWPEEQGKENMPPRKVEGLNVKSPLDQGDEEAWCDTEELARSDDALVRSYYEKTLVKTPVVARDIEVVQNHSADLRWMVAGGLIVGLAVVVLMQRQQIRLLTGR